MSRNRVLIVSASVGAGHMRAAEAVELEFAALGPGAGCEVRNLDILTLTSTAFRKLYKDAYLDMVGRAPEVFGWLYQATDRPFQRPGLQKGIEAASARRFVQSVRDFDPALAVCTHFLPAALLHREREKGRIRCVIATVITDFDVHGLWLATPSDHYFVAVPEARVHLLALGIPAEKITVSGIPTHPAFRQSKDRAALCAKHSLRPDLKTILLSTGGFGVGDVEAVLEALLTLKTPAQIVALCGRSAELKAKLERVAAKRPPGAMPLVRVLGFTTEMDEFMTMSDVVMGKPGGLTTWESFHKGLAWAVVNPIPGQEERNAIHLLEEGSGIWCHNPHTAAHKVDALLADAARLKAMP